MLKTNSRGLYHKAHCLNRRIHHPFHRGGYRGGGSHHRFKDNLWGLFFNNNEAPERCPNNSPENIRPQAAPSVSAYYIMPEKCHGCGRCKSVCQFGAISGSKREVHTIDPAKCMRCGSCLEACKHGAIKAITGQQSAE